MSIAEANPNDNQLHSEHSRCILFDSCEDRLSGYLLPNLLVNHRRRQALLEQAEKCKNKHYTRVCNSNLGHFPDTDYKQFYADLHKKIYGRPSEVTESVMEPRFKNVKNRQRKKSKPASPKPRRATSQFLKKRSSLNLLAAAKNMKSNAKLTALTSNSNSSVKNVRLSKQFDKRSSTSSTDPRESLNLAGPANPINNLKGSRRQLVFLTKPLPIYEKAISEKSITSKPKKSICPTAKPSPKKTQQLEECRKILDRFHLKGMEIPLEVLEKAIVFPEETLHPKLTKRPAAKKSTLYDRSSKSNKSKGDSNADNEDDGKVNAEQQRRSARRKNNSRERKPRELKKPVNDNSKPRVLESSKYKRKTTLKSNHISRLITDTEEGFKYIQEYVSNHSLYYSTFHSTSSPGSRPASAGVIFSPNLSRSDWRSKSTGKIEEKKEMQLPIIQGFI